MVEGKCEEVALEAEVTNQGALKLYQGLGFIRDKRLHRWVRQWVQSRWHQGSVASDILSDGLQGKQCTTRPFHE